MLLDRRKDDSDVDWQTINDLRRGFYNEDENRDTTRKGAKLLYEYIDGGWVNPPKDTGISKSSVAMNKDGSVSVEHEFTNIDPDDLKDPNMLLKMHGYDPKRFSLESSKNTIWTAGGSQNVSSKIVVKPKEQQVTKDDLEKWFIKLSKNFAPPSPSHQYDKDSDEILLIPLSDLHYGLKASKLRTHNEYDLDIAEDVIFDAVYDIMHEVQGHKFKQIVFTLGGDMLNADNIAGTTTKGTQQDNASDYFDTCERLYEIIISIIAMLLKNAPVHIIYVPGNHDMATGYQLTQYVKAWFRNDPNLTMDDSPFPRKYFVYGDTLMAFSHNGDTKKLPQLIADEAREYWSKVKFTEVFLQHLHSEKILMEEYHMRIQRLPTLSAQSAWTVDQGYMAARQHKSFIYDSHGLKSVIYTKL